MPIYEYCCKECKHIFEEWRKDFTDRDIPCPVCGASAKRMISSTAFILKGSGWYATDYARNSAGSSGNGKGNGNGGKAEAQEGDAGSASTDKASSSESTTSESKPSSSNGSS